MRTKKRALYVAAESTFGTDPSTNGSGYLYVPSLELGLLQDGKAPLPTDYETGRNFSTAPVSGPDGWNFDVTVPLIGLSTAAAAGVTPSTTEDWFGTFAKHTLGAVTQVAGAAVSSTGSTTALVMASDIYNIQDVLAVWEASLPTAASARTQWTRIATDAGTGTYTVSPIWAANPTAAAVSYGRIVYQWTDTSPATLAFTYVGEGITWALLGGRCTSMVWEAESGQIVRVKMSFSGDTKTVDAGKSSLPTATVSAVTPIKGMLSPFYLGGTKYAVKKISIDFGISGVVLDSTEGSNGRSDYEVIRVAPKVTVEPLFTQAFEDLKRSATAANSSLIQFGSGNVSGGILNSVAMSFAELVATDANMADDSGRLRAGMSFMATDPGIFSGSTLARFIQVARA